MTSPASYPALVLVGGWGVSAAMVEPVVAGWPGDVQVVSLDSNLVAGVESIEDLASALQSAFPRPAVWLGWSQGGQVAMSVAQQAPDQVLAVVTLCSFPRFVAADDWPYGMLPDTFRQFREGVEREPERYWKRFLALQVLGSADEKSGRRDLAPWLATGPSLSPEDLRRTLDWLGTTDQRRLWQHPTVSTLHLWGDQDYLVDSHLVDVIANWGGETRQVSGMGHWPRGSAVARCQDEIRRFVASLGVR
ncbi:alpha/beta fold hydrolase [Marinobacter zhejiangensis]|uniref:Pimeloyl-[acyl-carrier protein] methyl ester esterase n=1 Tax=Marinobacter zhejiangensis TaxID=488535 RepID=A0A1I4QJB7_9GAMM|nr:alpha/beta fold hydrolase [Marinobacter zhejiangensis]SFM40124.1 pimeloyl-[acyl-carrier protein] methyl ester esterase [Marinobacter zhejiangensis]